MTAEVALGGSTLTSDPLVVTLVRFVSLSLSLDAYPRGPTAVAALQRVQCATPTDRRARPAGPALRASLRPRRV